MAKDYRRLVKNQVDLAGIPYSKRAQSIDMILGALRNIRAIRKTSNNLYCPMRRTPMCVRPPNPRAGRPSNQAETTYIISVLRYVWLKTKNKKPTAHRRGSLDTPFVQFAEPILESINISNILDNLSRYSRSTKHLRT